MFQADLFDAATFAPAIAGCQFVFLVATPFGLDSAGSQVKLAVAFAPFTVLLVNEWSGGDAPCCLFLLLLLKFSLSHIKRLTFK